MAAGLDPGARFLRIVDRAEAIRTAAMLSRPGDILLIAGKGHETYQIIGDVKHHFDDKEEVGKASAHSELKTRHTTCSITFSSI